jgi:glycosyltransferase involved in cell wall biosynthesis
MRVCVLMTSYPRQAGDVAGVFVEDTVRHLRAAGVEVDVVSPASFPHFGIAYGDGIPQNLRARPWLALLLPAFLADEARALGARDVEVVPYGVDLPEHVAPPEEPPHVLYAGRLSEEKGILEVLEATEGLPRVIVGDGPLRGRVPEAAGFVPRERLGAYYERAAVVCVPTRREGYGVVAREAMAYGRPVVATRVGGLLDAVEDGVTGYLVDAERIRPAVERLLGDSELRARIGADARRAAFSWDPEAVAARIVALYGEALSTGRPGRRGA